MAVVLGCFRLKCLFNAFPRVQREVLEKGAKSIVLASHLGRPDGSVAARLKKIPGQLELEGVRSFAFSHRG